VDVEAVRDGQVVALGQVRRDLALVDVRSALVGQGQHHDARLARRLGRRRDPEAGLLGLRPGARVLPEADDHLHAGRTQVLGVRVALAPVADHGHRLVGQPPEVRVLVVVDIERHARLASVSEKR
jgi:hypothetical protein